MLGRSGDPSDTHGIIKFPGDRPHRIGKYLESQCHGRIIVLKDPFDGEDSYWQQSLSAGTHLSFWTYVKENDIDDIINELKIEPDFVYVPSEE